MPRKQTRKQTEEEVNDEEVVEEKQVKRSKPVPQQASAPAAAPKRKVAAPVAPTATEVSDVEETTAVVPEKKKRFVPTRDSVLAEIKAMIAALDTEMDALRQSSTKSKGVKFLRSTNKRLKTLYTHVGRVVKPRKNVGRKPTTNSGFLKPVRISDEMASFTGWNVKEPRSRVDVTKYICKYIKDHDLQNPDDRRQIRVEQDPSLTKLLEYTPGTDVPPLTYYGLQTYMKKHFKPVA